MINEISPERIANSLKMNSAFSGTYLLVEGQRDSNLLMKFINKSQCQIELTFGRNNLINALKILNKANFNRVLGIIDRDFDQLLAFVVNEPNLIITDFHDIEISVVKSSALDYVLDCYGSREKITILTKKTGKEIIDLLFDLAEDLAILKLANKIHNLGLVFKPFKPDGKVITYSDFIDFSKYIKLSPENLIKSIYDYSNNKGTTVAALDVITDRFNKTKLAGPYDRLHLCNGHDLTFILQLSLKKTFGSKIGTETSAKAIELNLILAFDSREFQKTILYDDIKKWEASNSKNVLVI